MNRREFVRLTGGGMSAGALVDRLVTARVAAQPAVQKATATGKARMKAGTQHGDSDAILRVLAGFGVNHICSRLPSARLDELWSVEALTRLRERVESFGLTLDMVPLPLSSNEISRSENPAILLGEGARSRPADRRHLPDDPQRRQGGHSIGQIQPDVPRCAAHGARRGAAAARGTARSCTRTPSRIRRSPRPAPSMPTRTGSASRISSSASCRSRRNTRSGSRAIRRIPACRAGAATAASRPCSGPSTA